MFSIRFGLTLTSPIIIEPLISRLKVLPNKFDYSNSIEISFSIILIQNMVEKYSIQEKKKIILCSSFILILKYIYPN